MAKIVPRDPDAITSEGKSISFQKDDESGHFRKVELTTSYNHLDYTTKKGKKEVSKNLYKLSDKSNFDYKFELTDPSGKPQTIYFKKI